MKSRRVGQRPRPGPRGEGEHRSRPIRPFRCFAIEGREGQVEVGVREKERPDPRAQPLSCGNADGPAGGVSAENRGATWGNGEDAPFQIAHRVVEGVLGREAVVNGHDGASQGRRQSATVGVLKIEVAEQAVASVAEKGRLLRGAVTGGVRPCGDPIDPTVGDPSVEVRPRTFGRPPACAPA